MVWHSPLSLTEIRCSLAICGKNCLNSQIRNCWWALHIIHKQMGRPRDWINVLKLFFVAQCMSIQNSGKMATSCWVLVQHDLSIFIRPYSIWGFIRASTKIVGHYGSSWLCSSRSSWMAQRKINIDNTDSTATHSSSAENEGSSWQRKIWKTVWGKGYGLFEVTTTCSDFSGGETQSQTCFQIIWTL